MIAAQGSGPDTELAVQVYRDLIAAERVRQQVFHDGALPKFLLSPPAVRRSLRPDREEARDVALRGRWHCWPDGRRAVSRRYAGRFGDRAFSSFRDADDRMAPVLEVFHDGNYLWLPLAQIRRLQVSEPK